MNKIFKNQKLALAKKSIEEVPDSEFLPDYIKLKDVEKDKKKSDSPKANSEAVPVED